jgi:membrane-bound ClpP family serine protease
MTKKYLILLYALALTLFVFGTTGSVSLAGDSTKVTDSTVTAVDKPSVAQPLVYLMDVEGAIGVVTDMRIEDAIEKAAENSAQLLIIRMDTPGGFMSATWSICKAILNSPVPVCI